MAEKRNDIIWIRIGGELPALEKVSEFVKRDHCGAVTIFQGVTRNHDQGKKVTSLTYDSYDEMALNQSEAILEKVMGQFPVASAVILHKTGNIPVGKVSMIVAASSPHRQESADAVLCIIEQIKKDVPIWKKEFFDDEGITSEKWKGD